MTSSCQSWPYLGKWSPLQGLKESWENTLWMKPVVSTVPGLRCHLCIQLCEPGFIVSLSGCDWVICKSELLQIPNGLSIQSLVAISIARTGASICWDSRAGTCRRTAAKGCY